MRDSGQFLLVVHEAMVKAGVDINALYSRLGYDAEKLPLRELRTPHQQQALFWQIAEAVSGDSDIGLHLCPHLPLYRGEVLEYLMFSSPTFGEGILRALKYIRLVSDALSVRLIRDDQGVRIGVIGSQLEAPQLRHTEICVVYELIQFARSVTESRFAPLRVKLRCSRRSPQQDYERVFGCAVEFDGAESEVWFDPAMLDYRSPRWDPDLLKLHEELAQKRLSDLHRRDLVERIRKVLSQRLELESCDLDDVAREVGLAPRRLRFELARAGTSFSQIVTDFRYALARKLLARTEEPIDNIVYLTGFSEPSTFYRAFKRWSGTTPVQYRESHRSPPAG
jgi:AraC-like DNA-binding protein